MWYNDTDSYSDVVVSTRIRLARNLEDIPFVGRIMNDDANVIIDRVKNAVFSTNSTQNYHFEFIPMNTLNILDRQLLLEAHTISPELAQKNKDSAVIMTQDGKLSIMVNEEDHIRIQAVLGGYNLNEAYTLAENVDKLISEQIKYANSTKYGYLTKCPTNTGTGLRASVMLHLPALSITNSLNNIFAAVNKFGIAIRGFYGEGSEASGDFYQLSNQMTLGVSEQESIKKLTDVVDMVIKSEREARNLLLSGNEIAFRDNIGRSLGLLKNAYIMSSEEFLKLISMVRMGISMVIIDNVNLSIINKLIIESMPAHIVKAAGENLDNLNRDIKRAALVRSTLN